MIHVFDRPLRTPKAWNENSLFGLQIRFSSSELWKAKVEKGRLSLFYYLVIRYEIW